MDTMRPEGTKDQSVTSTSGEALGRNVHVRNSGRIRKFPHLYNSGFGSARDCKNDDVASIVCMIQDGGFISNVDTGYILSLMDEWDAEDCMNTPSTFNMRESYVLKSQIHDPDTPTYMEALSDEKSEEHFKEMDDEFQSLIGRGTWEIVLRKSVADHNVI